MRAITRREPVARLARARIVGAALVTLLAGCANLGGVARPAASTLGCARAAVAEVVTDAMTDKRKHCTGAASIARLCSVGEARLASYGKEFTDIFDGGDPDVADLRADRAGIECAKAHPDSAQIADCCTAAGY
jgi:hypothetical protein